MDKKQNSNADTSVKGQIKKSLNLIWYFAKAFLSTIIIFYALVIVSELGIEYLAAYIVLNSPEKDEYSYALKDFNTVTVEVAFDQNTDLKVLGYDQKDMGSFARDIVFAHVNKRFVNHSIDVIEYGKPYSFQAHPLNMAVLFTLHQDKHLASRYWISAEIRRSDIYYSQSLSFLEREALFLDTGRRKFVSYGVRIPGPIVYIQDKDELENRLDYIAAALVEQLQPSGPAAK